MQELIVALLILDPHKRMGSDGGGAGEGDDGPARLQLEEARGRHAQLRLWRSERLMRCEREAARRLTSRRWWSKPDWAAAGGKWRESSSMRRGSADV